MANTSIPGSKLAPFFQKLEKLTKPQRMGIYAATLIVIVGLSVWLLLWPKHQKISALEKQLARVQQELAVAKRNASELNDWRNKMKQKEAQYKTVMRELPEKEEIPTLLAGISQAGRDAGLDFLLFQPKQENAKGFYAEIPVDINVSGTYHQVAVFFDKVSNLPRIVNIRDIKMSPASLKEGGGTLTTSCQAVTYKFVENSGKQQPKRRSGR
jgi:type IV pilus assembly protein PilO